VRRRVFGPQFIIEALFLAAVALAAGFAGLDPVAIVLLMAVAFLLVVAFDLLLTRARRGSPELAEPEAALLPAEPAHVHVLEIAPEPDPQPVLVAAQQEEEPTPEPEPPPAPEPIPPVAEPEPEPEPEAPRLEVVPDPEPQPEPEPEPEPERVVALPIAATPREWNVWELERLVRERGAEDEERAFLLVYLRDFATPEGTLPVDFDGLVRESFGELLTAGR
jgi:outer membrane biosynthesis protein TonB